MENKISLIGLLIKDRDKEAGKAQEVLTRYGNIIRTRLGLSTELDKLKGGGLILLELFGDTQQQILLEEELQMVNGIQVQRMDF